MARMSDPPNKGSRLASLVDQGRLAAERTRNRMRKGIEEALVTTVALANRKDETLAESGPEPPVVARLAIEIRSDGSRTIARGALEDLERGESVAIKAEGTTPAALAVELAKSLMSLPRFLGRAVAHRALLKKPRDD
jgi:hypothetical protein